MAPESEIRKERITVGEAEERYPPFHNDLDAERFPQLKKPFRWDNHKWEALKAKMQDGDELWTFTSSQESWAGMSGYAGIELVRKGVRIDHIITARN